MIVTRLQAGAAGLLLMAALAACSGSPGSSGVATLQSPGTGSDGAVASPSASLDPEAARLEFARCMRENGVDVPDPGSGEGRGGVTVGGDGAEVEELQAAMEACRKFLGEALDGPTEIDPEMQDKMLEFAECMRDNGVDFPDPGADGGGRITIGGKDGIDPSSPEFQAAQEACQSILGDLGPTFEGGPGGGANGPGVDVNPAPVAP